MGRNFAPHDFGQTASAALGIGSGEFTFAGWVKVGVPSFSNGATFWASGGANAKWQGNSGIFTFALHGGGSLGFSSPIPTGVWAHVAVKRVGNTLYGYINGIVDATTHDVSGRDLPDAVQSFGPVGLLSVDIDIAHFSIFGSALTDPELAALAAGANPEAVGSPIHYWPFYGIDSPEPDLTGARPVTLTGTSASSDDPPVDPPPTTPAPTTPVPTTPAPTTAAPTSAVPPTHSIRCARAFHSRTGILVARAWRTDDVGDLAVGAGFIPELCTAEMFSEQGSAGFARGSADAEIGVLFELPCLLRPGHAYFLRIELFDAEAFRIGARWFFCGTS